MAFELTLKYGFAWIAGWDKKVLDQISSSSDSSTFYTLVP